MTEAFQDIKTIAIVGAGVAGIATARALAAAGFQCTIFEKNSELGGVWNSEDPNLGIQVQKELYEFPDFPHDDDVTHFASGDVIRNYLKRYAKHHNLYKLIRFDTTVSEASQPDDDGKWRLILKTPEDSSVEFFDLLVVCVGLFSNKPHSPLFENRQAFEGPVQHNSEVTSLEQFRYKRVAVVGYGKSATDMCVALNGIAGSIHSVFRTTHWPIPPYVAGFIPFKWLLLNRLTISLLPQFYLANSLRRFFHILGRPIIWLWWRIVELTLTVQCRLHSDLGLRPNLRPSVSIEKDAFAEAVMLPRPEYFRFVRRWQIIPHRSGVKEFCKGGLRLESGEKLDVDAVILATGWRTRYAFLSKEGPAGVVGDSDGFYFYRHMVPPETKNLFFVGATSTIINIATYSVQAKWLALLLKGKHKLPSKNDMLADIEEMKAWKWGTLPVSSQRGATLILYGLPYHDQLLVDCSYDPFTKKGLLAPFKEVFAPYQPSDYRDFVENYAMENQP